MKWTRDRYGTRGEDVSIGGGPHRIGKDDLVAWFQQRMTNYVECVHAPGRDEYLTRVVDRNAVGPPELVDEEFTQAWQPGRLDIVGVIRVECLLHCRFDGARGLEAHLTLIETERMLHAKHHVANADDAWERDGVQVVAHGRHGHWREDERLIAAA